MNKKKIIYGQIALILIVIYPIVSLFLNNINEVRFTEILLPIFINIIVSEIIFVIIYILTRQYIASIVYSAILFYIGINFKDYFYKLIDTVYYWNAVPIVLYITIVILMIIHYTKIRLILDKLLLFATIGVVCSIGLVLVNNADKLVKKNTVSDNITAANEIDSERNVVKKQADLPNIYYIILDEYSSFKQMKKWYDYDNKEFYDFLKKYNFNIIEDSQNESMNTLTIHITTNLINLDYVQTDNTDFFGSQQKRNNPYLFRLLDEHGYNIEHYGGPAIGWKNNNDVNSQSTTASGEKFIDLIYKNNFLYPFIKKEKTATAAKELKLWDQFLNTDRTANNNFVFFHSRGGHMPFVFDEYGNKVSFTKSMDLKDKNVYVGQCKYITHLTMDAVKTIINKEPDSIIVIMSDHSMRYLEDDSGKKIIPIHDFQQVFNAVYFQGKHINLADNLSGVNTLRTVLDMILDTNMGVVDVP